MKSSQRKILFKLEPDETGYPPCDWEGLWATARENGTYEIDNAPFYVRDIGLGDIVSVTEEDGELYFRQLLKASSNTTVRVFVRDASKVQEIRNDLGQIGCDSELSDSPRMFALVIPASTHLDQVLEYLDSKATAGEIDFEESAIRYRRNMS